MCDEWGLSIRQACRVMMFDTLSYHYRSRRPRTGRAGEADQRDLRDINACMGCCGRKLVDRQEDLSRLSRDGLQLRDKTPKRPIKVKLRDDRQVATQATEIWALDFVHDQLVIVRKSRVPRWSTPTSRFSPLIDPRLGYRGEDVLHVLKKGCFQAGYPATIRVDQGSEFVAESRLVRTKPGAWRSTSAGNVKRPIMRSSGVQQPLPGKMPECPLVQEARRYSAKDRGLVRAYCAASACLGSALTTETLPEVISSWIHL
jgi:hypothetical protein